MTVSELIDYLKTQPQDLPVAYQCCSEYCTLDAAQLEILPLCLPRPDGWIPRVRPDKQTTPYLVFPGN